MINIHTPTALEGEYQREDSNEHSNKQQEQQALWLEQNKAQKQ